MNPVELLVAAAGMDDGRPSLEVAVELAAQARDLEDVLARLADAVRFAATVEAVDYERTSTRAVVTVRAGDEPEQLRTDRTDSSWGLLVARRAKRLVGHRVLIHKALEDAGTDRRVRVLVWLDPIDQEPTT